MSNQNQQFQSIPLNTVESVNIDTYLLDEYDVAKGRVTRFKS